MKYSMICCVLYGLLFVVLASKKDLPRRHGVCPWMVYKNTTCARTNFICTNKKCIGRHLYCNGVDDCGDNSDEHYCNLPRRHGVCPWMVYKNTTCARTNFICTNKKCIGRHLYCNGVDDCGDNSDEHYCKNPDSCYNVRSRRRCDYKCIPEEWFCDGIADCKDGTDEKSCDYQKFDRKYFAMLQGLQWLHNQSKPQSAFEVWGSYADKAAIALYFTDHKFKHFRSELRRDIAYEVTIQLLSKLSRKKVEDIPSTDLASFVNAFLVSCIDPRKFYGMDIVQELRNRVDKKNYTNPYVLLSLCNAGERITESDKEKLIDTFRNKRRTFWTDMQSVSVMALACANKQSSKDDDLKTLQELTLELKQHQYRNGTVENLQTTALVMQALFSAEPDDDPDNFDESKALEQIISSQKPDGSFGNLIKTYFVLPVLSCNSLVNISSDHCTSVRRDEISALVDLANRSGPKKRVQYSLWIGDEKDLERNLVLRVPLNMSLYAMMEIAAEIDNKYSFEYVVKDRKPYINAISDLQDNPEKGKFWFLYVMNNGKPTPAQESPANVMPKDNDHFIMWYRSGSWID